MSIQRAKNTPEVQFHEEGILNLIGRSHPENVASFYGPLIEKLSNYEGEMLVLNIDLEYFNTASSKKINELLRHIDANNKIQRVLVNWHYEEGDDDSVEMAEIFEESLLRTEFKYFEHPEAA